MSQAIDAGGRGSTARSWSLRRRLGIALLCIGLLLLGVVAGSGLLLLETRRQQQIVTGAYYDAGVRASDYFLHLVDSDTAVRRYALSQDPVDLEPLRTSEEPWVRGSTREVQKQISFDPEAVRRLGRVEDAAAAWYEGWAKPSIDQLSSGQTLTDLQMQQGEKAFSRIRDSYSEYVAQQRSGRAEAVERLRVLTDLLFFFVVGTVVITVAAAGGLWVLLRRWVSGPVARLAGETRVVGGGDLDHEVSVDGPPEIVGLGHDVEAMRRRLVDQIAAVAQAGQEILEARARLEEQAAELQRSNRELEQFAYVASHDLQEPLRKVASFCQLLEKRYAGQLDERADQYIAFAVDGAKRMQRLINDLLEFSRVGRLPGDVTDVDLQDCLDQALANLEVAREESGVTITADPMPQVRGEAALLTQVLQNLVGNAIKFRAEDRPPSVHLGVRRHGQEWEFSCADNGIGIAPEYADRVFVIFQRLHPKDVYTGTGIGLAMCKKIVEYHGGRIWVDTAPHEGTTIRWTLPVTQETPSTRPEGGDTVLRPRPDRAEVAR